MSYRSPFAVVFLIHIALEIPVAIQGIWSPANLPFIQLNNTAVVLLKLYASLVLGTCIASLLAFNLPDFLPGKRALAIGLTVYHTVCSTVLYQAPRFIPHSFGALAESLNITPEVVWGTAHGIVGLAMIGWWQATVQLTQMARAASAQQG
ncbi:hypothetical protein JR316_0009239 [Psilocybe cubensis]|uniref:Uncharacterized protein n=2 Tax=Psilocybe cubensis TaxID=181762 RepID=A0A8H7XZF5_PSICU|nr:hypothetical protein JR316_0009239 [Psilocybe cubensis]KAH9478778.1 hypothetical protein JR316_0009239 [Psilocybe cubensis]